jgi:hypothetical protein
MDLRQRILQKIAATPRLVKLAVPEWGEDVWIRRLTWPERIEFKDRHGDLTKFADEDEEGRLNWMATYVTEVCLDESGKRVFSPEDAGGLKHDSISTALERVTMAALRLNSLRMSDLDDLGKESLPILNGASPSDLPATSE